MKLPWLSVCAATLLLAAGCASSTKIGALSGTTKGWYAVSANQTPFYRYGPQQGNGADMQLPHDAIMKIIRPSFGYVKVELQSGEDGYVASEDIRLASASLVAEKLAPAPTPAPVYASQGVQFQLDSSDPRLIAPPEPLPEATPSPAFRY
ncbi:MAG TPA: hypothetical protein VGF73_07330 [Chthoniobacterales bacterium]|jgi:hypothetical protein